MTGHGGLLPVWFSPKKYVNPERYSKQKYGRRDHGENAVLKNKGKVKAAGELRPKKLVAGLRGVHWESELANQKCSRSVARQRESEAAECTEYV